MSTNGSKAVLTWSAPLNSGSGPVWGYTVYNNGVIVASNVTLTTCSVDLATDNNALGVCAFSSAGAGPITMVQSGGEPSFPTWIVLLIVIVIIVLALVLLLRRRRK
jgi:LPXTG-motif cell wall-anchored protein